MIEPCGLGSCVKIGSQPNASVLVHASVSSGRNVSQFHRIHGSPRGAELVSTRVAWGRSEPFFGQEVKYGRIGRVDGLTSGESCHEGADLAVQSAAQSLRRQTYQAGLAVAGLAQHNPGCVPFAPAVSPCIKAAAGSCVTGLGDLKRTSEYQVPHTSSSGPVSSAARSS